MTEGWWKYAKPGDKVVCVDARIAGVGSVLCLGGAYIISKVGDGIVDSNPSSQYFGTKELVWLVGVQNPFHSEGGFNARRFRPLQTKSTETGMAILKRILHGAPVKEDA